MPDRMTNTHQGLRMDWADRRKRVRAVFVAGRCICPSSVCDLSRIAKALGSEVQRVCGRHCLISVLGAPDIVLLTLSEFAEHAYRINRASTLPLLVDTDHGYGNGLDVRRTVEELESTGVTRD